MKHIRKHHLRTERWKDVKGYEGLYQVSIFGRVKSLDCYVKHSKGGMQIKKGRILKINYNKKNGYLSVCLSKNGIVKRCYVHCLVAEAFKPNPDNLPTVDHINRIKTDNRLGNLRWAPYKLQFENRSLESISKPVLQYTKDMVFVMEYPSIWEASRQTGINEPIICYCCKGNYKSAGGYIWKYKN